MSTAKAIAGESQSIDHIRSSATEPRQETLIRQNSFSWPAFLAALLISSAPAFAQSASERYMNEVLAIIEENALALPGYWPTLAREARQASRRSRDLDQVHAAISTLIAGIDDGHSRFFTPDQVSELASAELPKEQRLPEGHVLEITVEDGSEELSVNVAYLELPALASLNDERVEGYARQARNELHRIAAERPCGIVVDLRGNTGGNMWAMLAGVEPLLQSGTIGSFVSSREILLLKRTEQGVLLLDEQGGVVNRAPVLEGDVEPAQLDLPVAILQGPRTASSGEALAIALSAKGKARSFGGRTAGLTTSNQGFELSDGALLNLQVSNMGDAEGMPHKRKLEPDENLRHKTNRRAGHDSSEPALAASLEWLSGLCPL